MDALKVLGWAVWLLLSLAMVFEFIGYRGLTMMFPEGSRRWHFPAQLGSLGLFAAAVLCNPWGAP